MTMFAATMTIPATDLQDYQRGGVNPLDNLSRFVRWVEQHTSAEPLGMSGDPQRDVLCYYLREVFGAPYPHVNGDFWLSNYQNPAAGVVFPLPDWAQDLIYVLDVFGAEEVVTARDVRNALKLCRYLGEEEL